MTKILITQRMKEAAARESQKRERSIQHHFEVKHLTSEERNIIGFLGEFACCDLLNINWELNIRADYETIDDFDFIYKGMRADVKTETIPQQNLKKILDRSISDDELYGRRLINKGQIPLLQKYDIIIFGAMERDDTSFWHPIGWQNTSYILNTYKATYYRPDGGKYPFPGLPVHTSCLKSIENLINI